MNASTFTADTLAVATAPYRLRIPERCEFCKAQRTVSLQATPSGQTVALRWLCGACQRDWPVTQERRGGTDDRRRRSRTDRRKTNRRSS
jgi:transposase-like protein